MNPAFLFTIILTASLISFTGCDRSRGGEYPDRSVNTTRQIDHVRQTARDQKAAVDADHSRKSSQMDFEESEIRAKYNAERQEYDNALAKEETERNAKIRQIQIQANHAKEVIDAEVVDQLKTSPPEKAAEIQADATSKKARIDRNSTNDIAEITRESERSKATNIQQKLEVDREESEKISALQRKRSEAQNERNDKILKIDQWANDELSKVGKD